jgi:hypothetical protein
MISGGSAPSSDRLAAARDSGDNDGGENGPLTVKKALWRP